MLLSSTRTIQVVRSLRPYPINITTVTIADSRRAHTSSDNRSSNRSLSRESRQRRSLYGAKYPEISRINCVEPWAHASVLPSVLGTMAMFDVTAPSLAFSVDTVGCGSPSGHSVRKLSVPCGIAVALNTYPSEVAGGPQGLVCTLIVFSPLNGCPPPLRVSITRHGVSA